MLKRVNEQLGVTIVLITHQMNVVQQIANKVAVMSAGKIVERGDVYDVFAAPQRSVTRRFIATALSGLPDAPRVAKLHEEWDGRLVSVLVRQKDIPAADGRPAVKASGQNISDLIAQYGIHSGLVYGGMDTVGGSAVGAITYVFDDSNPRFGEFLEALRRDSDVIDFGTASHPVEYDAAVAANEGETR